MSGWTGWGITAAAALALAPVAGADETKREAAATSTQAAEQGAPNVEQRQNQMPPHTSGIGPGPNTGGPPLGEAATGDRTASAENAAVDRGDQEKQPSKHDNTDLIQKLWSANVVEIKAAEVAKDEAQSKDVKDFAERLEKDHTAMRDDLAKLAENRNLKLDEDEALAPHKAHLDRMDELEGTQFDRHYTQMMVKEHAKDRKDVQAALKRAKQTGDHELAKVLQAADKKMAQHQKLAQQLDKSKGQRMGRRPSEAASSAERSAEKAGASVEQGAERAAESTERSAEKAGAAVEREAGEAKDAAKDATR